MRKISKKNVGILIGIVLALAIIIYVITGIKFWGKKTIHEDAKYYRTASCKIYYPDSQYSKKIAKQICDNDSSNNVYDYLLVPYGDYYLVKYGNGYSYFVDSNYHELVFDGLNEDCRKLLSDYLRYKIKQEEPDKYYHSSFMEETAPDNIDMSELEFELQSKDLLVHFPKYNLDVEIPLKYIQKFMNMNFGYEDEEYVKPTYLDSSKPYICLTFEDGPDYLENGPSKRIVDTLSKYDATATFFVPGNMLDNSGALLDFLKDSIRKGNEYGSHGQNQEYLTNIFNANQLKSEVNGPIDFFRNNLDYTVNLYRPPGGLTSSLFEQNIFIPAICWGLDSLDWMDVDIDTIVNTVLDNADDGVIVALHDIYEDTAQAIEQIVPKLVDKGFQIITVSDALSLEGLGYDVKYWYGY